MLNFVNSLFSGNNTQPPQSVQQYWSWDVRLLKHENWIYPLRLEGLPSKKTESTLGTKWVESIWKSDVHHRVNILYLGLGKNNLNVLCHCHLKYELLPPRITPKKLHKQQRHPCQGKIKNRLLTGKVSFYGLTLSDKENNFIVGLQ